jgi:tetratricopeptide (TPR) repeat protein
MGDVSRELVEAELRQILSSSLFSKAPRHSRFLSFVVGKTLAGEAENIKEYLIGVEVFDRPSGYDPGSDPIVRAEARRLRSRLADYYRKLGQYDPIHIELPKGTYVPVFHKNGAIPPGIADVEDKNLEDTNSSANLLEQPADVTHPLAKASPASAHTTTQTRWLGWAIAILVLLVVVLLGYGVHKLIARRSATPGAETSAGRNVLVLADFTNTTGDALFDHALRQALSAQIEQSPFFDLLSDQRIAQTLTLMSQPNQKQTDLRLTDALAREVCQRTGSTASIEGSITNAANGYALALQAVDCRTGATLASEHVNSQNQQQVLAALGQAAAQLRQNLGESLASVQRYDAPPENVTTASLEALQAYSLGTRAMMVAGDYDAAIPYFQRAISLDPNFAMACARLGTSYENVNQNERSAESLRQAYALRQRVSDRERFYIDSHYYQLVTGDLVAARATYELWAQTYPRDDVPNINLGRTYAELGDLDKSLASYQKALTLNPGSGLLLGNLVYGYLLVDRPDESRATAQLAASRHLDSPEIHLYLYWVDFVQHDAAGMAREVAALAGKPGYEDLNLYQQANTAAYAGQISRARDLTSKAAASAEHADDKATAAGYIAIDAVHQALVGDFDQAKRQARSALALAPGKEVQSIAGLALALAGDSEQCSRLTAELAKAYPQDTVVQFIDLPTMRAAAALQHGSGAKAIAALAPSAPYDFGRGDLIWLYPVYLRAQAYLAAHQSTAAAGEFQLILDHPGAVLNEPIGALAHLGLARAYSQSSDIAQAKTAYQDFLALWKSADPDLPILKQAQSEYASLR